MSLQLDAQLADIQKTLIIPNWWNTDRLRMQTAYSPQAKGWEIKCAWRRTDRGIGLFACETIKKGAVMRRGRVGHNLLELTNLTPATTTKHNAKMLTWQDRPASHRVVAILEENKTKFASTIKYLQDYFYAVEDEGRSFFGVWLPGVSVNHSTTGANLTSILVPTLPGSVKELHDVATKDICEGEEICSNYITDHGDPPTWVRAMAKTLSIQLPFKGLCGFLDATADTM